MTIVPPIGVQRSTRSPDTTESQRGCSRTMQRAATPDVGCSIDCRAILVTWWAFENGDAGWGMAGVAAAPQAAIPARKALVRQGKCRGSFVSRPDAAMRHTACRAGADNQGTGRYRPQRHQRRRARKVRHHRHTGQVF